MRALSQLSRAPRPRDRGRKGLTTSDGGGLAVLGYSLPADALSDDGWNACEEGRKQC